MPMSDHIGVIARALYEAHPDNARVPSFEMPGEFVDVPVSYVKLRMLFPDRFRQRVEGQLAADARFVDAALDAAGFEVRPVGGDDEANGAEVVVEGVGG